LVLFDQIFLSKRSHPCRESFIKFCLGKKISNHTKLHCIVNQVLFWQRISTGCHVGQGRARSMRLSVQAVGSASAGYDGQVSAAGQGYQRGDSGKTSEASAWWPKLAHWPAHGSQGGAALFKVTGRHISHGGGEEKERTNAILFF